MSERTAIHFLAAVPADLVNPEWLTDVFHHLWNRGIVFTRLVVKPDTWDQQLHHTPYDGTTVTDWPEISPSITTLAEFIREVPQYDGGLIAFVARDLAMDLTIRKHLGSTPAPIKWLSMRLSINVLYGEEMRDYLSHYTSFLRWCAVLCEITNPLYAFGIRPFDEVRTNADEKALYYEGSFFETIEDRILRNDFPTTIPGFSQPPYLYLSHASATPLMVNTLLERSGYRIQRLVNQGIFGEPLLVKYTPEHLMGKRYESDGSDHEKAVRLIVRRHMQHVSPWEQTEIDEAHEALRQANLAYQRANEIYQTTGDRESQESVQRDIASLLELAKRINQTL